MTSNEAELRALMTASLRGDVAAHRTLLGRLSRHLRAHYKGRLARIADRCRGLESSSLILIKDGRTAVGHIALAGKGPSNPCGNVTWRRDGVKLVVFRRKRVGSVRLIRTILAMAVAFSVVMLPAVGAVAFAQKATEIAASATAHDCCDHGAPCEDSSKAAHDRAAMAACAAKCFNYIATVASDAVVAPAASALQPMRAGTPVGSEIGHPPFRPPRV